MEEIGISARTPTFLAEVECLAAAIDSYIIPSLRMETHRESWSSANLREEIPDFALQGGIARETIAEIISHYLSETISAAEAVGEKRTRFYQPDPITYNTSFFEHQANAWRCTVSSPLYDIR